MSWYTFVKFLHIFSAMWFVGGLFARQLVRQVARKADDVRLFATLSQAAGKIEAAMVITGSTAVILIGVMLALITGYAIDMNCGGTR